MENGKPRKRGALGPWFHLIVTVLWRVFLRPP